MAKFSQKKRELILKISGFHEQAWGSRGVYVGHDLSAGRWAEAIERALASFPQNPFILQTFEKSRLVDAQYFDFEANAVQAFKGRVRLCPYYFVMNDTTKLGGILATICPADKKLLHGMTDAVLAPCRAQTPDAGA
jgi:coproporphyrinogen III oxidase